MNNKPFLIPGWSGPANEGFLVHEFFFDETFGKDDADVHAVAMGIAGDEVLDQLLAHERRHIGMLEQPVERDLAPQGRIVAR